MNRKDDYQDERWKERAAQIRKLDNYKCALCGTSDVELHVHHLSYPPPPFHLWDSTDNELITLCKECHEKVHDSETRPTLLPGRTIICKHRNFKGNIVERNIYKEIIDYCRSRNNGLISSSDVKINLSSLKFKMR